MQELGSRHCELDGAFESCSPSGEADCVAREMISRMVKRVYYPALCNASASSKLFSSLQEELIGMAEGSGTSLENLIMLNAREELATIKRLSDQERRNSASTSLNRTTWPLQSIVHVPDEDESVSAHFPPITTGNDAIAVHTRSSTRGIHNEDLIVCLEIHHEREEQIPAIFTVTEAGLLAGSGMNSSGLVVTASKLLSGADFIPISRKTAICMPSNILQRLLLQQASIENAYVFARIWGVHISMCYQISDREGRAVSFELAPQGHLFVQHRGLPSSAVLHTNHFQSFEAFLARRQVHDRCQSRGSYSKLFRLRQLVDEAKDHGLSVPDITRIFTDHANSPHSICEHAGGRNTELFVLFNSTRRTISVCKGPPCQNTRMMHFTFDDDDYNHNVVVDDDSADDSSTSGTSSSGGLEAQLENTRKEILDELDSVLESVE